MRQSGAEPSVRFWVTGPGHVKRLARKLSPERPHWCYFGTDTAKLRMTARAFASCPRVSFAEELNSIAYELKQPFLDWVGEIGARQDDQLNWWASKLASKSTLQTDFFLLVCYHVLFRSWVAAANGFDTRVVVVEDPWLRYLLERDFAAAPQVGVPGDAVVDVIADASYWLARVPLSMLYVITIYIWRMLFAWLILPKPRESETGLICERSEILLFTWIEPSCFTSPGKLADAYMGRLEDLLTKHGETIRRFTPIAIKTEYLRGLKSVAQGLLVTPHYLRLSDILSAATSFFWVNGLKKARSLKGCDYLPLFYREVLREWGHPGFMGYQLTYRAIRQLAREYGHCVKCVIYPFENQPWEKMLCLAFRKEAPAARLIGYQHATVSPLELCYFLGQNESKFVPLPDVIATNSEMSLTLLRLGGLPEERLVNGGAFRYEYLFTFQRRRSSQVRTGYGRSQILVALPITRMHAQPLLRDLLDLFGSTGSSASQVEFVIKCHPDLPLAMLMDKSEGLPQGFTVTETPLRDLFDMVDGFLYAAPTSSWCEAYVAGLPVLKYRSDSLDIDWADALNLETLPICSRESLKQRIEDLLRDSPAVPAGSRTGLVERIFSPVNESVWLKLVANESDHHK